MALLLKRKSTWYGIGVLMALLLIFLWFSNQRHIVLIPNVPYVGILAPGPLNSSAQSAVGGTLAYWRDYREGGEDTFLTPVIERFGPAEKWVTLDDIEDYFDAKEYETEVLMFESQEDIHNALKKKTPLIIYLPGYEKRKDTPVYLLVIGSDLKKGELVAHENTLGNNYTLSYSSLREWVGDSEKKFLAVHPRKIEGEIKGPRTGDRVYPIRTALMEDLEVREILQSFAYLSTERGKGEDIRGELKTITNTRTFEEKLPRWMRVAWLTILAEVYMKAGEYEKTIALLEEKTLPLNKDLTQYLNQWPKVEDLQDELAHPWIVLGDVHIKIGNKSKAQDAYIKAGVLDPSNQHVIKRLNGLNKKREASPYFNSKIPRP